MANNEKNYQHYLFLLLILFIGVLLRVFRVSEIPPGLYRDEAFTGMDAVKTLAGDIGMFYTSSFGREPLFTWLTALSVAIWGKTPFATRFPSLVVGVLTLISTYLMSRQLYDKKIALFSTAVLSIMLWHVHFSRVSFRAILIPLFTSLSVWQTAKGIKRRKVVHWILGGVSAGVLLYTYIAARAAILPAILLLAYSWWREKTLDRKTIYHILIFVLAAAIIMLPFLIYTVFHWEEVFLRVGTVESIFNMPKPLLTVFKNFLGALGMFFVRGDFQYRHNVPLRPVFDPALGLMFLIGLWQSFRKFRTDYASAFLLLWIPSLLIPTILAKDSPHFIRSMGIVPFVALLPGIGLDWLWTKVKGASSQWIADVLVLATLFIGLVSTSWAYFQRFPSYAETCYWFECEGTELASEVNAFLGTGWTKRRFRAAQNPAREDRQVYVQLQLWKDVVNAHYLIHDTAGFNVPGAHEIVSVPPEDDIPMLFYGWNNDHFPRYWNRDIDLLPADSILQVQEGAWGVTHQQEEPHPAYIRFLAMPANRPEQFLAEFDDGIRLVDGCVIDAQDGTRLRLIWYAESKISKNYKVFVHLEDEQIIAQADRFPAHGYHLTPDWRPGDQLLDEYELPIRPIASEHRIWVGMYLPETIERLSVLHAANMSQDDRVEVNLRLCGD